jgi:hypothetical protein
MIWRLSTDFVSYRELPYGESLLCHFEKEKENSFQEFFFCFSVLASSKACAVLQNKKGPSSA